MTAPGTRGGIRREPVRALTWIVAIAIVLTLAGLGQVYLHLQLIATGYQISRETRRHHTLVEQNQKLRLELATRMDPVLVEQVARHELGMAEPDPRAIRVLRRSAPPVAVVARGEGRR